VLGDGTVWNASQAYTADPANPFMWMITIPQQVTAAETFSAEQTRLDNYAGLLAELADLRVQMIALEREQQAYVTSSGKTTLNTTAITYPTVPAHLLNGGTVSTSTPTSFSSYYFPHTSARRAAALSYVAQAMALPVNQWPNGTLPTPVTSAANTVLASLQNQLNATIAQVVSTQQAITQALVTEWNTPNRGCLLGLAPDQLDAYPQSLNSCDWSPTALIQNYMGRYELERQNAYNRCVADTPNGISATMGANVFLPLDLAGTDFRKSLYLFELYLADYETRDAVNKAYLTALSAMEQNYMTTSTSLPVQGTACATAKGGGSTTPACLTQQWIGESTSDSHSIGGQYFGANVSYGGMWRATPALQAVSSTAGGVSAGGQQISSMEAEVSTYLTAGATVFGDNATILDGQLDIVSTPGQVAVNEAHLTFLTDDIWNGPERVFRRKFVHLFPSVVEGAPWEERREWNGGDIRAT